ncbi:MAG: hypothetical protein E7588_08355 [Ruminococcaceae bacterium]|nr:hypothetical protein [Oscillospiraceae bacterium]
MKKLALLVMAAVLVLCLVPCVTATTPQYDEEPDYTKVCEIRDSTVSANPPYLGTVTWYSEKTAAQNGVPGVAGVDYSGHVWKVTASSGSGSGVNLDFTKMKIPANTVKSVTIRVYTSPGTENVRFSPLDTPPPTTGNYVYWFTAQLPIAKGQWVDYKLTEETLATYSKSFGALKDSNGYFTGFGFNIKSSDRYMWIDSVTVDYDKEPDYTEVCEIRDSTVSANPPYPGAVKWYSEKTAAQKGAPGTAGVDYSGHVWYVADTANGSGTGVNLDFTKMKIPANTVKSVTVRLYAPTDSEEYVRFSPLDGVPAAGVNYSYWFTGSYHVGTGQWYDYTLTEEFLIGKGTSFSTRKDSDGYFTGFGFNVKNVDYMWIDSVTVEYDEAPDYTEVCEIRNSTVSDNPPYIGNVIWYGEELAALRGAPGVAGVDYKGHVWKVTGQGSGTGVNLDFSGLKIPADEVESVTVRLYASEGTDNVRYSPLDVVDPTPGTNNNLYWIPNVHSITKGKWIDYEITEEFVVSQGKTFSALKDSNGYFTGFGFNLRQSSNFYMWIDEVTVKTVGDIDVDGEMLGAQIRTTAPQGLRFGTQINFTDDITLEEIKYTYVEGGEADTRYAGTIILPVSELPDGVTAATLTHENAPANNFADVKAENIFEYNDTFAVYTAVVLDITEARKSEELIARAYIYYDGAYHYFDPVVRSVVQVETNIGNSNDSWNNG